MSADPDPLAEVLRDCADSVPIGSLGHGHYVAARLYGLADEIEGGGVVIESGYIRKGLNTRIAEALKACPDILWDVSTTLDGRLQYHIEQAGEVYFFSPGRCAEWLGLTEG